MAKIEINLIDPNTEVIVLNGEKFVKCKTTGEGFVNIKNGEVDCVRYEVNIPDDRYDNFNKSFDSSRVFLTKEEAMKATGLDQF